MITIRLNRFISTIKSLLVVMASLAKQIESAITLGAKKFGEHVQLGETLEDQASTLKDIIDHILKEVRPLLSRINSSSGAGAAAATATTTEKPATRGRPKGKGKSPKGDGSGSGSGNRSPNAYALFSKACKDTNWEHSFRIITDEELAEKKLDKKSMPGQIVLRDLLQTTDADFTCTCLHDAMAHVEKIMKGNSNPDGKKYTKINMVSCIWGQLMSKTDHDEWKTYLKSDAAPEYARCTPVGGAVPGVAGAANETAAPAPSAPSAPSAKPVVKTLIAPNLPNPQVEQFKAVLVTKFELDSQSTDSIVAAYSKSLANKISLTKALDAASLDLESDTILELESIAESVKPDAKAVAKPVVKPVAKPVVVAKKPEPASSDVEDDMTDDGEE